MGKEPIHHGIQGWEGGWKELRQTRERQRNRVTDEERPRQMWLRKPDGDTRWKEGAVDPKILLSSWGGSWGTAFLDPLFFSVFVCSKVYLAPCSLGVEIFFQSPIELQDLEHG